MKEFLQDLITFRQNLHKIPEVGFKEYETQKYIINSLEKMGYFPKTICNTGVYLYIPGKDKNFCKAFRADMDALPIKEENNINFKSQHNNFMHACGHDGHMSILLAFAKYLKTIPSLDFSVLLIFQPAEEGPGGAKPICESGILETFNVKEIYGLHLFPDLPQGVISTKEGIFFAQATEFDCTIKGKGGHGGIPHKAIDPLIPFCKIIDSYQSIVSRNLSPFDSNVITVGHFTGGYVRNIIPENINFYGTIRSYSQENTHFIIKRIKEIHRGFEQAFSIDIQEEFRTLYPPVINNKDLYNNFLKVSSNFNFQEATPLAIAEDFSFYQERIPGLFFLLGTKNIDNNFISPLHSSTFNFNEEVLLVGLKLFIFLLRGEV